MDKKKYLSDYEAFTENEISDISSQGIALKSGIYIDFNECTKVWAEVNSLEKTTCVGERDVTDLSFTFYTHPKPIMIKYIPKGRLTELFSKHNTVCRFHDLQNKIYEYGFTTFDIS